MQLILEGEILAPIISKKTTFRVAGCNMQLIRPRRRWYSKINTGKPMFPYALSCFLGKLEVHYTCKSREKLHRKLQELLQIDQIGPYSHEGLGRVKWKTGRIIESYQNKSKKPSKLRIRKGLPHNLPESIQNLIMVALLHDFVHTTTHASKIYQEIPLKDGALLQRLKSHHDKTPDPIIQRLQHYDQIASRITRKIRAPTHDRYNWRSKEETVDFERLAQDIIQMSKNVWKLYEYILNNPDLAKITESLEYGHSLLKQHLLIIVNLIVQDFLAGKLEDLIHGRDTVIQEQNAVAE